MKNKKQYILFRKTLKKAYIVCFFCIDKIIMAGYHKNMKKITNLILKNFVKHKTILTVAIGAITSSFAFSTYKAEERTRGLCSQSTIQERLDYLSNDGMMLKKNLQGKFFRMPSNQNDPVYVCFSETYGSYPEYKQIATKSLNYVFGFLHGINSDYTYSIVDKTEFTKQQKQYKCLYSNK